MAILYTISLRNVTKTVDGVKTKVKMGYALAKQRGVNDTDKFASQMQSYAGNSYARTAFIGIMADIKDTLREIVADGFCVDCGQLGKFFPSLSSNGVYDASRFNPQADIKKVYARWKRPEKLANIQDPSPLYELAPTTEITDAGKKAAKKAQHTAQIRPIG